MKNEESVEWRSFFWVRVGAWRSKKKKNCEPIFCHPRRKPEGGRGFDASNHDRQRNRWRNDFSFNTIATIVSVAVCALAIIRAPGIYAFAPKNNGPVGTECLLLVPSRCGRNKESSNALDWHGFRQQLIGRSDRKSVSEMLASPTTGCGGASGASSSSKNLWSIEECLDEWNKQQQDNQHPPTSDDETEHPNIVFVDATWFHKGDRNGRNEFEDGRRLPGAFHWDTGDLATSGELFPKMNPQNLKNVFPPEWMVGEALSRMGVASSSKQQATTTLVVYGREGTLFAPRVWYLLKKYARCCHVRLLQGSLEEWVAKGGAVEDKPLKSTLTARDLIESRRNNHEEEEEVHPLVSPTAKERLVDKEFVLNVLDQKDKIRSGNALEACSDDSLPSVIIDTRGSSFAKNGHIPSAMHLPYASLSLSDDPLTLKPVDELEAILKQVLEVDTLSKLKQTPPLLTCGTGVSVCTLALVLDELGFPEPWIYDGSWDEWGKDPATPKEGGEQKETKEEKSSQG